MAVPNTAEEMAALPAQEQLSLIREWGVATGRGDEIKVSDLQLGGVGLAIIELENALADAEHRADRYLHALQRVLANHEPRLAALEGNMQRHIEELGQKLALYQRAVAIHDLTPHRVDFDESLQKAREELEATDGEAT